MDSAFLYRLTLSESNALTLTDELGIAGTILLTIDSDRLMDTNIGQIEQLESNSTQPWRGVE
ncbi:MAG: hypothetical protein EBU88_12720 [Acidobacteria bacterium]|nr:hypothetical protein [Acidobacteriota bacterium]